MKLSIRATYFLAAAVGAVAVIATPSDQKQGTNGDQPASFQHLADRADSELTAHIASLSETTPTSVADIAAVAAETSAPSLMTNSVASDAASPGPSESATAIVVSPSGGNETVTEGGNETEAGGNVTSVAGGNETTTGGNGTAAGGNATTMAGGNGTEAGENKTTTGGAGTGAPVPGVGWGFASAVGASLVGVLGLGIGVLM